MGEKSFGNSSYTGGIICPRCGKPYTYTGDPVDNIEDLICTCGRKKNKNIDQDFYLIEHDSINKGWVCPKCGRVFSPSTTECPYCNLRNNDNNEYLPYPGSTGDIPITFQY